MNDLAIKFEHVYKQYKLGLIGGGTLKDDLQSLVARMRGKEDPNVKIGVDQAKIGEKFLALNDVSFEVKKGEALGIIGHNGAGKSTLLKLLSRVTAPTKGKISFNGRITSMLEVGTGFHGELTGVENIYMNGAILGMTKAEIKKRLDEIIEFSELRKFIDTPVKRYSSGMYVKLGFAVASHLDSEIMIMDEVLAVGDVKFQQKCLTKMREAAEHEGRTVLYVSHNMSTIRQLCKRCIVLDHGQVVFDGDTEDAIRCYMGRELAIQNEYEYTIEDHAEWCSKKMLLRRARFLNDTLSFFCGQKGQLEVEYDAVADLENVGMRLVFLGKDGIIVGMAMASETLNVKAGTSGKLRFDFDTSILAPGEYTARISFFNVNQLGNHDYVCIVNQFISFKLQKNPDAKDYVRWNISSWGRVAFPSFHVEQSV